MKKFIVTKKQLKEFLEFKKNEKIFFEIVQTININKKFLNESISLKKINQTVINNYYRKKLITPKIEEMLINFKIINNNREII